MSVKATFPVGVSVLITKGESVLLGVRKNNSAAGQYSTPGGRLEHGETIQACAVREAQEETGLLILKPRLIGYQEHFRFGGHYIMFYVQASEYLGALTNTEPEKCKGWEWHPLKQLPVPCTEPKNIIDKLLVVTGTDADWDMRIDKMYESMTWEQRRDICAALEAVDNLLGKDRDFVKTIIAKDVRFRNDVYEVVNQLSHDKDFGSVSPTSALPSGFVWPCIVDCKRCQLERLLGVKK